MKQSLLSNVIQFSLDTAGGTLDLPSQVLQHPCNNAIISLVMFYDTDHLVFKILQDGKQIFPVRSNLPNGFYKPGAIATGGIIKLDDLYIPVNPNSPLTVVYCNDDSTQPHGYLTLVMAMSDNQIKEAIDKLVAKINLIGEVKK